MICLMFSMGYIRWKSNKKPAKFLPCPSNRLLIQINDLLKVLNGLCIKTFAWRVECWTFFLFFRGVYPFLYFSFPGFKLGTMKERKLHRFLYGYFILIQNANTLLHQECEAHFLGKKTIMGDLCQLRPDALVMSNFCLLPESSSITLPGLL